MIGNGYGSWIQRIQSQKELENISNWKKKKCTENTLIFQRRMSLSLSVGLKVEKCSEVERHLNVAGEGYFISVRDMKQIQHIITNKFSELSVMVRNGPGIGIS